MTETPTASQRFTKTAARALYKRAHEAGLAAMAECTPEPMIVGSPTHPLGSNIDPSKGPVYRINAGVCGFAWINMPGNTSLARQWKAQGFATPDSYLGGVSVRAHVGGQSYELKCAYIGAFAGVLQEAGVPKVYVHSRLD